VDIAEFATARPVTAVEAAETISSLTASRRVSPLFFRSSGRTDETNARVGRASATNYARLAEATRTHINYLGKRRAEAPSDVELSASSTLRSAET
jgi:hypothetical protein